MSIRREGEELFPFTCRYKFVYMLIFRYAAVGLPKYPNCKHSTKSYRCSTLTMLDIKSFHNAFYENRTKIGQDNFIVKYTQIEVPTRRRNIKQSSSRQFSSKYFIAKCQKNNLVPVCRQAFLSVLCIGPDRVKGVLKRHFASRTMARERRGGNRKEAMFQPKKEAIITFIKKFRAIESHYCRSKSACRVYLPSSLNIRRMWILYQKEVTLILQVKESYFRQIFNTHFNIGFGSPRTDVCSKCLELGEKLKEEKDPNNKNKIITELRVHKLRAKAFFAKLSEKKDGLLTISFDCQKNLTLPKIPDQSVYYSRQLYMYNFTTVTGDSHSSLTPENVRIFAWTEDKHHKGANEIASAVFYTLNNSNLDGIEKVRLVADGCGGQNKNSIMLAMCFKWLSTSPVKEIELVFPIVGHSYIPPDRVFGKIEKVLRKIEQIVEPSEYLNIFKQHGTVVELGKDVPVMDWKTASQEVLNPPARWHFKFNMSKRFILKRGRNNTVSIRGEQSYMSDLNQSKSVCKRGKTIDSLNPLPVQTGVPPKIKKLQDVASLLSKHYGAQWKDFSRLDYYKQVLEKYLEGYNGEENNEDDVEDRNDLCEAEDGIPDLLV